MMNNTTQYTLKAAVRDGLTTAMDFEAGIRDTAAWYAEAEGKTQVNYGHVACAVYARVAVLDGPDIASLGKDTTDLFGKVVEGVGRRAREEGRPMGWNAAVPDKLQMTQIMELVDEELRQGALGVGCAVGYMTHGVTSYEMFKYQELAAKYGRLTNAHTRFAGVLPPTSGALGIQEIMSNAMVLNAAVMVAHCNSVMDWEFTQSYINLARKNGHKIMGESYPYHAGSTLASADILSKEGMNSMGITYENVYFVDTGERWTEETWKRRMDSPGRTIVIEINAESDIPKWMKDPETLVCSDGMPAVDPGTGDVLPWDAPLEGFTCHPRGAGSRGKFLRMLREELKGELTLMQGLAKMTYLPAKYFCELAGIPHFRFKGRMQEGCDADICVFDPDTVTDNATYKIGEGMLPTTGMPYVLVSGVPVVMDSVVQKVSLVQGKSTGRRSGLLDYSVQSAYANSFFSHWA